MNVKKRKIEIDKDDFANDLDDFYSSDENEDIINSVNNGNGSDFKKFLQDRIKENKKLNERKQQGEDIRNFFNKQASVPTVKPVKSVKIQLPSQLFISNANTNTLSNELEELEEFDEGDEFLNHKKHVQELIAKSKMDHYVDKKTKDINSTNTTTTTSKKEKTTNKKKEKINNYNNNGNGRKKIKVSKNDEIPPIFNQNQTTTTVKIKQPGVNCIVNNSIDVDESFDLVFEETKKSSTEQNLISNPVATSIVNVISNGVSNSKKQEEIDEYQIIQDKINKQMEKINEVKIVADNLEIQYKEACRKLKNETTELDKLLNLYLPK